MGANPSQESPNQKLIAEELKDKRDRVLCFNCDEKFKPGHRCAKLFWLELKDDEEEALPEWVDAENFKVFLREGEELPAISLLAITGAHGPCTMWIKKTMGDYKILLLVDSESIHNFISTAMAQRVGISSTKGGRLDVLVANGEWLLNGGVCRGITIWLENDSFVVDFYILDIEGCEAGYIRGYVAEGLRSHLWDFSSLWMSFVWEGDRVVLQEISTPQDKVVDGTKFLKLIRGCCKGTTYQGSPLRRKGSPI